MHETLKNYLLGIAVVTGTVSIIKFIDDFYISETFKSYLRDQLIRLFFWTYEPKTDEAGQKAVREMKEWFGKWFEIFLTGLPVVLVCSLVELVHWKWPFAGNVLRVLVFPFVMILHLDMMEAHSAFLNGLWRAPRAIFHWLQRLFLNVLEVASEPRKSPISFFCGLSAIVFFIAKTILDYLK